MLCRETTKEERNIANATAKIEMQRVLLNRQRRKRDLCRQPNLAVSSQGELPQERSFRADR
jgi:hypothetical protein